MDKEHKHSCTQNIISAAAQTQPLKRQSQLQQTHFFVLFFFQRKQVLAFYVHRLLGMSRLVFSEKNKKI